MSSTSVCVAPANMDILAEYPRPVTVIFISTTEVGAVSDNPAPDGIANTDMGGYDMVLACGQASDSPSRGDITETDPYPDRMRDSRNLKLVVNDTDLLFERFDFYGYDPTLTGAAGQDPDTLQAIADSLINTPNDAYMQSRFTNGIIGNWAPNYFAPIIKFGDLVICDHTNTGETPNHLGLRSFGPPLPYGEEYRCIVKNGFDNITMRAQLVQPIPTSAGKQFQRYFLMCVLRFRKRL